MKKAALSLLLISLSACVPPQDPSTTPPPQGDARPTATSGPVLLVHAGHTLTMEHVDTAVSIIEFITGEPIADQEKTELTESAKEEFPKDPAEWLRQIENLKGSLSQLRQLQDPLQIGMARQMLVSAFHKATRGMAPEQVPLLLRVVYRYVSVLAFDEASSLALTNKDVAAMVDYMEFTFRMAGSDRTFSDAEKVAFSQELATRFPTLPIEQKRFLCSANFMWRLVKANYQRFTPEQRAQLQQQYTQAQAQHYQPAGNDEAAFNRMTVEQQRAYLQQKSRDNLARQNMFTIMNNVATQNHATMLNTIENFGGTGNYWQVVP